MYYIIDEQKVVYVSDYIDEAKEEARSYLANKVKETGKLGRVTISERRMSIDLSFETTLD